MTKIRQMKQVSYAALALTLFSLSGCAGAKGVLAQKESLSEISGFEDAEEDSAEEAGSAESKPEASGSQKQDTGKQASSKSGSGKRQGDEGDTLIYVQVSGAVANPGVYSLPLGSRVFEAVAQAGGMTEEADFSSLNQAELLSDGQMVQIPKAGEAPSPAETTREQQDGRVNLNTATEEQLMTLPGIGSSKAKSIIAWREGHGGFAQIEDLMQIEGIKEGVFSKIKDSIKVN